MKRVFLVGCPLGHSVSPVMQNAAFRATGLDWQYELLETSRDELPAKVARLREQDCAGANVTIPHKQTIIEFLDDVTDAAREIGAVNTIVKRGSQLVGENTDAYGFLQSLRVARVGPATARAVILGAGGAARAVAFALAATGAANIAIVNRTTARAMAFADELRRQYPLLALTVNHLEALGDATLFVNATPVGMAPSVDESPMPGAFPRGVVAFDLVYCPIQTQFLRDAERAGAQTVGGIGMLVHQGAAAFELWTGQAAPVELMSEVAHAALSHGR